MTVQELIDKLQEIEEKDMEVFYMDKDEFRYSEVTVDFHLEPCEPEIEVRNSRVEIIGY